MSWPMVALGDVVKVNPRLPKDTDESQLVTFLKMASVSEQGELLEQESRVLADTKKGFTYFERNDVLLAKITPCFENGKAALVNGLNTKIGFGSTEFHVLRAMEGKINKEYLFYLVWNEQFRFLGEHAMKGAAGQQRISADFLKGLKIPLPPLETQKQIAAVLEKADQLRKDCQKMEQELNGLAQSLFIELFGDPVTNPKGYNVESLGSICEFENGDRSSNYPSKGDILKEGKLFLSSADIGAGTFTVSSSKYISLEKYESLSRGKCKTGDILMTLRGNGLGRCCVFECEYKEGFVNAQMVILRAKQDMCDSRFLVEQLNCPPICHQLLRLTSGSAQPQFSAADVKKFKVLLPPVTEQKKYNKIVQSIKLDLESLDKQMVCAEELFNSLMQKAFKGELKLKAAA